MIQFLPTIFKYRKHLLALVGFAGLAVGGYVAVLRLADERVVALVGLVVVAVLVARPAADRLVAAGTERPAAVLRRGAVPGQEDTAHVGLALGVVERVVEFVDRLRAEGVADLGAVEGDPDRADVGASMVGDVAEVGSRYRLPAVGVEQL